MSDIQIIMNRDIYLDSPVTPVTLANPLFAGDAGAQRIRFRCYQRHGAAAPLDLSSTTITAYFIRPDDGTVVITGVGGTEWSYVDLPQACYVYKGLFKLLIRAVTTDVTTSILYLTGRIEKATTDTIIDPGTTIPSLEQLLAQIDECEYATDAANAAAANATAATSYIADTYTAGTAYAVGDLVIHGGSLYKCNTAVASATDWTTDGSSFTATTVDAELLADDENLSQLSTDLVHYLSLDSDDAVTIPAESDLNNYTTPGKYKITTMATAETISNIPYSTSGVLIVLSTTQSDRYIQIYVVNSDYYNVYYRAQIYSAGTWSAWSKLADMRSVALTTLRDVYPDGNGQIDFELNGTTITATLPRMFACWLTVDGTMSYKTITNGTTIAVPHDNFAIFNIQNLAVEVKTFNELALLTNTSYIVLFYNHSGFVHGLFEKYAIGQRINSEADVFFYGTSRYPTFSFLSDYSINVTIPDQARVNYYDLTSSTLLFKNGAITNITAQTINVPHDKCLVYDISTRLLSVENYDFAYDQNKTVLFYNSHGIINGKWYRYYLLQRMDEEKNGYPAYFADHLKTQISSVNTLLSNAGSSGIVFVTDHHYPDNDLKSVGIAKTVCRQTGINKLFLGGDYINRETSKTEALRNINRIAGMYAYPGVKTFRICGNHEFNNPGASSDLEANELSASELRNAILSPFADNVVYDDDSLSYYYDDTFNKIRYIVGSVTRSSALDSTSVKWVCDQLLLVPNDYSVVVMFHTILSYSGGTTTPVNSASDLLSTLDALKNRTSYTFGGTTYDFSNSNADLICAICGDMHVDTDYTTAGGVHVIATTTDSMQESGGLTRTIGDISEIAFDVFVFNTTQRTIKCIRIGAGEDRNFSY